MIILLGAGAFKTFEILTTKEFISLLLTPPQIWTISLPLQ